VFPGVTVNSLHPGVVATDIYRQLPWLILPIANFFVGFVFKVHDSNSTSSLVATSFTIQDLRFPQHWL